MRNLLALFALPALLSAAILPENVGKFHKTGSRDAVLADRALWDEYTLQASEDATYDNAGKPLHVLAYRLQDSTAALAAFDWQRPAGAKPDERLKDLTALAVTTASGSLVALGNHLVVFEGYQPTQDELAILFRSLPRQSRGPLPTLPDHMPPGKLLANSELYIIGPVGLAKFLPEISSSVAAFHLGTEVETARYRTAAGEMKMAIFSFPTMDSARERTALLEKTPNTIVKRSGPLVAVVLSPKDLNAAETLLSQVRYQAEVTTGQKPTKKQPSFGNFLVNLVILIGIVLVFCLLSGLMFGGILSIFRRGGETGEGDTMISLHLSDR